MPFDLPRSCWPAVSVFLVIVFGICAQAQVKSQKSEFGPKVYQDWLTRDVVWIITPQEREAFKKLTSNDERDRFVDQFWLRRNPEPGSGKNLFKEEHYRRIAYSNVHFATADIPGWKSDRGHIYIVYGRPDSVDSHAAGRPNTTPDEGGGASADPYEVWHYRHLDGVGDNIEVEFIDKCRCGDYKLNVDHAPIIHMPN